MNSESPYAIDRRRIRPCSPDIGYYGINITADPIGRFREARCRNLLLYVSKVSRQGRALSGLPSGRYLPRAVRRVCDDDGHILSVTWRTAVFVQRPLHHDGFPILRASYSGRTSHSTPALDAPRLTAALGSFTCRYESSLTMVAVDPPSRCC